jgi:hypothetical protein
VVRLFRWKSRSHFTVGSGASGLVGEVKVQADGKIVLAGSFVSLMVLSVIE